MILMDSLSKLLSLKEHLKGRAHEEQLRQLVPHPTVGPIVWKLCQWRARGCQNCQWQRSRATNTEILICTYVLACTIPKVTVLIP